MRTDKFDEEIRRILSDFEDQYDPMSWDQLNEKLDQSDLITTEEEDQEFDKQIRAKIAHFEVPTSNSDWLILQEELDRKQERHEKIVRSKIIEAAIVFLLVLTISKYKTLTSPHIQMDKVYFADLSELHDIPASIIATVDHEILTEQNVIRNIKPPIRTNAANGTNNAASQASLLGPIDIATKRYTTANTVLESQNLKPLSTVSISIEPIQKQSIQPFDAKVDLPEAPVANLFLATEETYNNDGWSIGLPISIDVNFINTNFNVSYLRDQFKNKLGGKSIGISTSYRKGGLEIESGIEYSEKKYAPALESYTKASANSFLLDKLDAVNYRQIQVPLLFKVYASPKSKISFYGMAGMAANLILDIDETIIKKIEANARPSSLPHVVDAGNLKKLPRGFMEEGGSFSDNLYLTAVIGAGVQINVAHGFSWYLQPQYQHTISNDINIITNQINSLSLEAGVKYKF